MTHDKKQPGLPVVEVDQAFPLMTTDAVSRSATSTGVLGDQGPTVSAAIRDVLGWRPRVQDTKAFTAALAASFELSTVEDHVVAKYVPRGVAVQADLGAVTGGQASLYLRAKASHEQITRMLDSLKPLRTDADPQDCEAYRGLVRDSVRRIVMELGREGGPRVPLVDSAFSVLSGYQPSTTTTTTSGGFTPNPVPGRAAGLATFTRQQVSVASSGGTVGSVPTALAEIDPDTVPGQLGALRDRFGLDDDHVNTVDEEKQRTSFWTLVELITDLQRSWDARRLDFTLGAGNGFLGTDLVQISRLLAATSEQIDEFEAVLDSVLVSGAERQTVVLDQGTGLTLDDLVQWLRVFITEDGPSIIRETGRDGLVSSFTPTVAALLLTLREKLVRRIVPCGGPSCAGGCHCGARGQVTCIPLGCCTPLPPGLYAGRVKIAVSTLCGLVERLTAKAIRIGRFAGVVLLDLSVVPFDDDAAAGALAGPPEDFVRAEVRGLHLRPTYVLAFVADGGNPANMGALVLPLQGSASGDNDRLTGIFQRDALPSGLLTLLDNAGGRGVLMAASEVPLAIIDGELGRLVQGPAVTTWPRLRPAGIVAGDGGPDVWDEIPPNQRFVPQSPSNPEDPDVEDYECLDACGDDCAGCDCGCHLLGQARSGAARVQRIANSTDVGNALGELRNQFNKTDRDEPLPTRLWAVAKTDAVRDLLDAVLAVDCPPDEGERATRGRSLGIEVLLPELGTNANQGTVLRWATEVGKPVEADQPLVLVRIGKIDVLISSPVLGVLQEIRVEEGQTAEVGSVLAVIGEPADGETDTSPTDTSLTDAPPADAPPAEAPSADAPSADGPPADGPPSPFEERIRREWAEQLKKNPNLEPNSFAMTASVKNIVKDALPETADRGGKSGSGTIGHEDGGTNHGEMHDGGGTNDGGTEGSGSGEKEH